MINLSNFKWYRRYKGGYWQHYKTVGYTRENVDYWCRLGEDTLGVLVETEFYEW